MLVGKVEDVREQRRLEVRLKQFLESGGAAMRLHTKEELCLAARLGHSERSDKQRK
jgi:hypothetical protein